jgi:hypothetical protein
MPREHILGHSVLRTTNLLCLCPNHRLLFDLGAIMVADDMALIGMAGRLRTVERQRAASSVCPMDAARRCEPTSRNLSATNVRSCSRNRGAECGLTT